MQVHTKVSKGVEEGVNWKILEERAGRCYKIQAVQGTVVVILANLIQCSNNLIQC